MPRDHYKILVSHVVRTLPPGVQERMEVLEALLFALPADHKYLDQIRGLLLHLHQHSIAQRELDFNLLDQANHHKPNDADANDNPTEPTK